MTLRFVYKEHLREKVKLGVTSSKAVCYHVSLTDANFHKPSSDFIALNCVSMTIL